MPHTAPSGAIPGLRPEWIAERWFATQTGQEDERLLLWSWLSLQGIAGPQRSLAIAG
jgi:hypothetical protein